VRKIARNQPLLGALLASLLIFGAGVTLGYTSISADWAARSMTGGARSPILGGSFLAILVQNATALMFLYSGVLTLGLTSVLGMGMVSAYIGATAAVGIHNVGTGQMLSDTGAYAFLEFGGCVVAAAAGLYPMVTVGIRLFREGAGTAVFGAYLDAVYTSLKILASAGALVVAAAAIEATAIALR
jgi:hypothetical protein